MVLPKDNTLSRTLGSKHSAGVVALACGMLLLVATLSASAQSSVTLAWDPSPSTDIKGYKIYYGGAAGAYTNVVTVGNTTNATVAGLKSGVVFYFAATAFDNVGVESAMSNEISYLVQAPMARLSLGLTAQKRPILSGTGPVGYKYDVQASPDLKIWSTVASVTVDSTGVFQYTDTTPSTNLTRRMYRLRQTSP